MYVNMITNSSVPYFDGKIICCHESGSKEGKGMFVGKAVEKLEMIEQERFYEIIVP